MDEDDLQHLIDGGVYDPAGDTADEVLDLIEYLEQLGATVHDMLAVKEVPGGLAGLAAIAALPKVTVSLDELAFRAGVSAEHMAHIWTVLGLIVPAPEEPALSEQEAEKFLGVIPTLGFLSEETGMQVLRAAGNSSARLADALIQSYLTEIETELATPLARARLAAASMQMLDANIGVLEVVLKRHMTQSAFRLRTSQAAGDGQALLAIGFVDLAGFTPLSMTISTAELAAWLDEFECVASDSVNANGGWVVKLIGDAVMFAALEPSHAVHVVVSVMDALGDDHPDMTPTGGVAYGPVLPRGGDYFGPVVNLAARVAAEAIEHEVLITREINDGVVSLPKDWVIEPAGRRQLKGIDEPVPLWSLRHLSSSS